MFGCELKNGSCGASTHSHHIISKQKLKKNPEGKKLVEDIYPHIFMAELCDVHHEQAHNRRIIRLLLLKRAGVWGTEYVRDAVNEVADTFVDGHEFRWEALI